MTDVGTFSGPNWRYEDGVFSFFNFSGFVFGRRWALPVNDRGDVHLETPRPIRRDVDAVIADDIRKGKGGMIDYVSMGAYETLRLALEGVITIRAATQFKRENGRKLDHSQCAIRARTAQGGRLKVYQVHRNDLRPQWTNGLGTFAHSRNRVPRW